MHGFDLYAESIDSQRRGSGEWLDFTATPEKLNCVKEETPVRQKSVSVQDLFAAAATSTNGVLGQSIPQVTTPQTSSGHQELSCSNSFDKPDDTYQVSYSCFSPSRCNFVMLQSIRSVVIGMAESMVQSSRAAKEETPHDLDSKTQKNTQGGLELFF